jgi:hypothetical protein
MKTFPSKKDVFSYLIDSGWQIGRSQFYEHCRQLLVRPTNEGKFEKKDVDRYAKRYLRQRATGQKIDDYQEKKNQVELETARVKLEKEQHDLGVKKGKFVHRDEFELAIVARAVSFMAHLSHAVQSSVGDWIELVDGDQHKAADLVAAITEEIEQRMSDFAADAEFEVILEANE